MSRTSPTTMMAATFGRMLTHRSFRSRCLYMYAETHKAGFACSYSRVNTGEGHARGEH